jgi:hypothetical protein
MLDEIAFLSFEAAKTEGGSETNSGLLPDKTDTSAVLEAQEIRTHVRGR